MIRISITRLKPVSRSSDSFSQSTINDKNLDYEIETRDMPRCRSPRRDTINDKNLDYEIETRFTRKPVSRRITRSMIRISITRLKLAYGADSEQSRFGAINDKNLDYEIETQQEDYPEIS